MVKKSINRPNPPEDVEAIILRHVRTHTRGAVLNLQQALAPLRERRMYDNSPMVKFLEDALREAQKAEQLADRFRLRVAPQEDLGL